MAEEPYYMEQPPPMAQGSWGFQPYTLNPAEKKKLAAKRRRGFGFQPPKKKRRAQ